MNREELIQSYYEYINQRLGGRPYFTDRRGHPNLVSYHAQIGITQQCMYKWLSLMEDAIDACDDIISRDIKSILMTFFTHLCSTYHVASNLMQQHENAPLYDDDFPVNCPIISTSNKQESIISSSDSVIRHKEYKK